MNPHASPLPFSGATPISRHHSAQAAQQAATTRGVKTRAYLELLESCGPLSDHQAAQMMGWPLSSVCSIRNGCGELVQAVADREGWSPYGRRVTLWRMNP